MRTNIAVPHSRGPLSRWLLNYLGGGSAAGIESLRTEGQGLTSDLQLALYLCYEPHFGPLPGVVVDWEWDPTLLRFRRSLETAFEASLRDMVDRASGNTGSAGRSEPVRVRLPRLIESDDGPSVSQHMETSGTLDELREFLIHRSGYQLKEGDAHTFAIPRLRGRCKQLLVEIQAGEYGADAPGRIMHSELFAHAMASVGLDDRPNAYLDIQPASSLMISNLVAMFGLNRRWRGALVGHLAVFEMTSVPSMRRYSRGLDRMGAPPAARRFFDVHVLADAEHEIMALDMAQALEDAEPALASDIVFGAQCVFVVERLFAEGLLGRWQHSGDRAIVAA